MDFQDWAEAVDPAAMLTFAGPRISARKLRLYLVGCCRRRWELFTDPVIRHAVEVAERFADGETTDEDRRRAERLMGQMFDLATDGRVSHEQYMTAQAAYTACLPLADLLNRRIVAHGPEKVYADDGPFQLARASSRRVATREGGGAVRRELAEADERVAQTELLRCLVPQPTTVILPDPRWLTSDVVGLARSAYIERDFSLLPILADALQDAGCEDPLVHDHCRTSTNHTRGCWVVDLALGLS